MAVEKTYAYKISRNGTYLGTLDPNLVSSMFGYGQDVNSASVQVLITYMVDPYVADQTPPNIELEAGGTIDAEDNSGPLTMEHADEVVGNSSNNILVRNNNDIEIWEYSDTYPNGKIVFSGYISKWRAVYGTAGQVGAKMTCLSNGTDLKDYVVQPNYQLAVSRLSTNRTNINQVSFTSPGVYGGTGLFLNGQKFVAPSTFLAGKIRIKLAMDPSLIFDTATVYLYSGDPTGAPINPANFLAKAALDYNNTTAQDLDFVFDAPVTLTSGNTYHFLVETTNGIISGDSTRGISSEGLIYQQVGGVVQWYGGTYDLYYAVYSSQGVAVANFSGYDPTDIFKAVVDDYSSQGGDLDYNGSSTDNTGLTVTYNFKLATTLEAINKILELAPYDFYWFADPATGILYFKRTQTTAEHVMVLGQHITELEIEASVENVINDIYFSGGDTGSGSNLFKHYENEDSIESQGRRRLARISDNRVTLAGTAEIIANSKLDAQADEDYTIPLTVSDSVYDITLFQPGDTVGFAGFGNWIDRLIVQIAHVDRYPDYVMLTLGVLPKRAADTLKNIEQDLTSLQTVDNPSSPS